MNYELEGLLKKEFNILDIKMGGKGIVFICKNTSTRDYTAIKTLRTDKFNSINIKQFEIEAEIWISLGKHKNIVYAWIYHIINKRPFILMEVINGDTLSGLIKSHKLKLESSLSIAVQICQGMEYAQKIFKESNQDQEFIHGDLSTNNILITLDNIAKITDFGMSRVIKNEETGKVIGGTLFYMSPEQHMKKNESIGVCSDVYSLGCILYEMITGKLPFDYIDTEDYIYKNSNCNPVPFKDRNVFVDKTIEEIVMKCLAKQTNKRYSNFFELRIELERFSNYKAIEVKEKDEVLNELELISRADSFVRLKKYKEALTIYKKVLKINPSDKRYLNNAGDNCLKLEEYDKAIIYFNTLIQFHPEFYRGWFGKGEALFYLDLRKEALSYYEKTINLCESQKENTFILETDLVVNLDFLRFQDLSTGETDIEKVYEFALYRKGLICLGEDEANVQLCAEKLFNKAQHLYDSQKLQEALICYDRALSLREDNVDGWIYKGNCLLYFNDIPNAKICFDKAIDINCNSDIAWYYKGLSLVNMNNFNEALICFEKATSLNYNYEIAWLNKGVVNSRLENYRDALSCYKVAIDINPENEITWYNSGICIINLNNNIPDAIECFKNAIKINPSFIQASEAMEFFKGYS